MKPETPDLEKSTPVTSALPKDLPDAALLLPRVNVHYFPLAENDETARAFVADRRMSRTTTEIIPGGLAAAVARYQEGPTPNLLIIEGDGDGEALLGGLDELASYCDPTTHVVVIGKQNDIALYRAIRDRGVEDYLLAPVTPQNLLDIASRIFCPEDGPARIGRVISVIGAKGGVGASTVAQNIAWRLSESSGADVMLIDMDFAFGASAINCNVEASGAGVMAEISRLDNALLDRMLSRKGAHLCLLPAPATLEKHRDPTPAEATTLIDLARRHTPFVVLDLPHVWNDAISTALLNSDAVGVVTTGGLASIRNAAMIMDELRTKRPNDDAPRLILNQHGAWKRAELDQKDIKSTLNLEPDFTIPFDPKLFGTAESQGMLASEVSGGRKVTAVIDGIAKALAGRETHRAEKRSWLKPRLSRRKG